MTSAIELVVIDLDGTLLDSNHRMSDRTETVLKQVMAQGVKVVIATGKTHASAVDVIKRLNLDTPGIYNQGLVVVYPDGRANSLHSLDPDLVRRVVTFAEDRGFVVVAYSLSRLLTRSESRDARELSEHYHEPMPEEVGPLQNLLEDIPINKLLLIRRFQARKVKALRWQLNSQLDGKARLVQALDDMLEVLPPKASKGAALRGLLHELGIPPERVLAIGDGENDIEMIQLAGYGVAMGNAAASLKETADYVVSSNDADGVAEAMERFVLKPTVDAENATESPAQDSVSSEPTEQAADAAASNEEASEEAPGKVSDETTEGESA